MEAGLGTGAGEHAHVRRKQAVQGTGERGGLELTREVEGGDLALGVNPGVRPARAGHGHPLALRRGGRAPSSSIALDRCGRGAPAWICQPAKSVPS